MEIKRIDKSDMSEVRRLVTDVFMEFEAPEYSEEGVKTFFYTAINNRDFMDSLVIYGAYSSSTLLGVIATRNNGNHIALFFVDGKYHRQGIGKKLFESVLNDSTDNKLTVNSSPYAREIYHKLGFKDTDVEQNVTGIRFYPMSYRK